MGICCCKCENKDNLENQQSPTVSTIVTSEPCSSNSRPFEPSHLTEAPPQVISRKSEVNRKHSVNRNKYDAQRINDILDKKHKINLPYENVQNTDRLKIINTVSNNIIDPTNYKINLQDEHIEGHLFRPKKVIKNIDMVKEILQFMYVPKRRDIPMKIPYVLKKLDIESKEYNYVKLKFSNKKFKEAYEIKGIEYVWNPYLYAQYQIMKEKDKDSKSRILYHGTQMEHLESILSNNFDWRAIRHGKYGWGVSFANNPWYSSHYSVKLREGSKSCVMLLVRVLVGKTSYGFPSTIIPIVGDTTTNPDGQVLVKFDDASFYPEFVIYFEPRAKNTIEPGSLSLDSNEILGNLVTSITSNGSSNHNETANITKEPSRNSDISNSVKLEEPIKTVSIEPIKPLRLMKPIHPRTSLRTTRSLGPKKPLYYDFMRPAGPRSSLGSAGLRGPTWSTKPWNSTRPINHIGSRMPTSSFKAFAPRSYKSPW